MATSATFNGASSMLLMSGFHDAEYKDGSQNHHQRIVEGGEQSKQFHDVSPPTENTDQNNREYVPPAGVCQVFCILRRKNNVVQGTNNPLFEKAYQHCF